MIASIPSICSCFEKNPIAVKNPQLMRKTHRLVVKNPPLMAQELGKIVSDHRQEETLLVLDSTSNEESLKIFLSSAQYVVLDAKVLHTKRASRHCSIPSLLEEGRHLLSFAMMHGKTLVLRLGDAAVDFRTIFCDEACGDLIRANPRPPHQQWSYLPYGFMLKSGAFVNHAPFPDALLRRDDLRDIEDGAAQALHPLFRVIVSTTIPRGRLDDLLFNGRFGLPGGREDFAVAPFP